MRNYIFIIGFILILAGCSGEDVKKGSDNTDVKADEQTSAEENEDSIEVDKGLLNVEVTIPGAFFDEDEIEETIEEAKAAGVKDVIKNEDGSLTYKMTKKAHKQMLKEMQENLNESIEEIKNDDDYPSIQDIRGNKDHSEFNIVVDREDFENSFDGISGLSIAFGSMLYQLFAGANPEDYHVVINYEDVETGEVFDTVTYPDALNEN